MQSHFEPASQQKQQEKIKGVCSSSSAIAVPMGPSSPSMTSMNTMTVTSFALGLDLSSQNIPHHGSNSCTMESKWSSYFFLFFKVEKVVSTTINQPNGFHLSWTKTHQPMKCMAFFFPVCVFPACLLLLQFLYWTKTNFHLCPSVNGPFGATKACNFMGHMMTWGEEKKLVVVAFGLQLGP